MVLGNLVSATTLIWAQPSPARKKWWRLSSGLEQRDWSQRKGQLRGRKVGATEKGAGYRGKQEARETVRGGRHRNGR